MSTNCCVEKIFESIDKQHQIKITIIDNIAWFNINALNYKLYKTFLLLLKDVMSYLASHNITHVKQYVSVDDLENFPSSSHVDLDGGVYIISTPIINFLEELSNALGIKKM